MNVRELRNILERLDGDQLLVINWYDGGPAMLQTAHLAEDGDLDSDDDLWVQE